MFIHPNRFPFSPVLGDLLGSFVCTCTSWLPGKEHVITAVLVVQRAKMNFPYCITQNFHRRSVICLTFKQPGHARCRVTHSPLLWDQNKCVSLQSTWLQVLGKYYSRGTGNIQYVVQDSFMLLPELSAVFQLCLVTRWCHWVDVSQAVLSETAESWSQGQQRLSLSCTTQFSSCERLCDTFNITKWKSQR